MDPSLNQQLSLAAVAMSAAALFFSLLAAFPGLKSVLAAVRDGVLWFALFLVLGAVGFLTWKQMAADQPPVSASTPGAARLPMAATAPQSPP